MPMIEAKSSTGKFNFHYTITTPTSHNADCIDPDLPVVLFFHALAFHPVFHSQFVDASLREFNLVAFDLRWHGDTASVGVPESYGQKEAAEDVIAFMEALRLPPCHFVAIDLGTMIALQVAIEKPHYALSMVLMSHTCLEELQDVNEGRTELYNLFISDVPGAQLDCAIGYTQYAFSNNTTMLSDAVFNVMAPVVFRNWSAEHRTELRFTTHEIFVNRKPQSRARLARLNCPVKLFWGTESIVYPLSYSERFLNDLKQAGVEASLSLVEHAPHYLCLDYASQINPEIYQFIVENVPSSDRRKLRVPVDVISPWDEDLRQHGWDPERNNALDDDDFTVSFPC